MLANGLTSQEHEAKVQGMLDRANVTKNMGYAEAFQRLCVAGFDDASAEKWAHALTSEGDDEPPGGFSKKQIT